VYLCYSLLTCEATQFSKLYTSVLRQTYCVWLYGKFFSAAVSQRSYFPSNNASQTAFMHVRKRPI